MTFFNYASLSLQVNAVKDYCVSFGMPSPRLEGVDPIEEDLTTTESSWALFKEYSSELKVGIHAEPIKRMLIVVHSRYG